MKASPVLNQPQPALSIMLSISLHTFRSTALRVLIISAALMPQAYSADTTPAAQLQHWSAQAGSPGNANRGEAFFNSKHGAQWSCASCHGAAPTAQGKHANTGKLLAPLAPASNASAFTESAKVEKWFRRNCNDVVGRECTAGEKADVLAYLISLKRI
jgi:hypothetical protein